MASRTFAEFPDKERLALTASMYVWEALPFRNDPREMSSE
jgi:hypothetical protein